MKTPHARNDPPRAWTHPAAMTEADGTTRPGPQPPLPAPLSAWFAAQDWAPHPHQLRMLAAARAGQNALLIAPTGGGKTLGGFLPSLVALIEAGPNRPAELHTLYLSPLKALTVDVARNLTGPIADMNLDIRVETRTGDTPQAKRQRQRTQPPDILLTTPESLALLLSYPDAAEMFAGLKRVVIDELHAMADGKRGDQMALCVARLGQIAPRMTRVGLSATVPDPDRLTPYLSPTAATGDVTLVTAPEAPAPDISILDPGADRLPWSGHMATWAVAKVYELIRQAGTAIVFVNTRAQAELVFQDLWDLNEDGLAIGLHHGSLTKDQRRKMEAMMAAGRLRAVVATASLDLGIDWAAVDLVIQVGAPKGVSRLLQRTGRSNHRLDAPSRAVLVPGNRFEVLECRAALEAVADGTLDGPADRPGGLDVLAQHIWGLACGATLHAADLYAEVRTAAPYCALTRADFDAVLDFVATGGYALKSYDRYQRLGRTPDGGYRVVKPLYARQFRMNVGTIVEATQVRVRLAGKSGRGGRVLGQVEEYFVMGLAPGDTFLFAGELLEYIGMRETDVIARRAAGGDAPKIPAYAGGRLPLSTHLADRVRAMLADPTQWAGLPAPVREWLELQRAQSVLPAADGLLVETFPRNGRWYLVAYAFAGRNAHQTLGMLLTKRMERAGLRPMGFVANDYVITVWSLDPVDDPDALLHYDMMGDDLEEWLADSTMLKRLFRTVGVIAGLIDRKHPGQEKTARQLTVNTDLIYDVLRRYQPDHVLLRATRADAAGGLTDVRRLSDLLTAVHGRIAHRRLDRVSPLAVPILLEIGKEFVHGGTADESLLIEAEDLLAEATA